MSRGHSLTCLCSVITDEITVYRYSHDVVLENLKGKVGRLSDPRVAEMSRTLIRSLAKDDLMDDGKEELLECASFFTSYLLLISYIFTSRTDKISLRIAIAIPSTGHIAGLDCVLRVCVPFTFAIRH